MMGCRTTVLMHLLLSDTPNSQAVFLQGFDGDLVPGSGLKSAVGRGRPDDKDIPVFLRLARTRNVVESCIWRDDDRLRCA